MLSSSPTIHRPCAEEILDLALQDVSFAYPDGTKVLRNVDLGIARGESIALLGANGSGKSTLLKLLDGLVVPTSGQMHAFGGIISNHELRDERLAAAFRRRIGFVFQNSDAQLFSSTVREEIAFGPLQLALPTHEIDVRIAEIAAMLAITNLLDRPPYRLSGGEKRKVAIASVLVSNPTVVLLDEPTSGLDPRSRQWLIETLVALSNAGKTIIVATHDLEAAPRMAKRAIVLAEDGSIAADASVDAALADHGLLARVNLIHDHVHWHGSVCHSHPHHHGPDHEHTHQP